MIQKTIQTKIKEKKVAKVSQLQSKNQSKKYKKFLLLKKFKEDYEDTVENDADDFVIYQSTL